MLVTYSRLCCTTLTPPERVCPVPSVQVPNRTQSPAASAAPGAGTAQPRFDSVAALIDVWYAYCQSAILRRSPSASILPLYVAPSESVTGSGPQSAFTVLMFHLAAMDAPLLLDVAALLMTSELPLTLTIHAPSRMPAACPAGLPSAFCFFVVWADASVSDA